MIAAANLGSILIPLPLLGVCKSLSFFIISFKILFSRAIDSNSRWCFSSSFACLLLNTTEAAVPAADVKALIPAITSGINANRGKAFPSIVTFLLKVEPSSLSRTYFGSNFTCSRLKNLVLNLLHIEHIALI